MATASFNPKFRPVRTFTHEVLGRVDEYVTERIREDGSGAQATFLRNNARPNHAREYGIKLFRSAHEAFAAFQRQKIAAEAGLAPPVRRMVKMTVMKMRRFDYCRMQMRHRVEVLWGYQTCLAYGIGKIEVPYEFDGIPQPAVIRRARGIDSGVREMFVALVQLNLADTQRGDKKLGTRYGVRAPRMCEDLHAENLGFWRKRPVVIDFGAHIVGECCYC